MTDVFREVRERVSAQDAARHYGLTFDRRGWALCPFHNEKSPSFSVSPGKQMYYCFGCGAGGNVITFLMEYENYTFAEALKVLADRSGVTLPQEDTSREAKAREELRTVLLRINKQAANYFYWQLHQPQGEIGYRYFKNRALTDETMKRFGLGFAGKSGGLYQYLKGQGYDDGILKETGLFTIEERGARDKFWNRVMFPIMDVNNRVIGFGGRVMGDGTPKYLNSPETKIFDKSRNLYGLNYARTAREGYLLVCEGYMDVIALHQAGFTNSVASLGTALTSQHANLLKRYTEKVVLTYDSDGAGVKAALRAIPILKEAGISTRVLNMEPYKDPDEFIKNLGAEEFRKRIEGARNSFLFEIDVLKRNYSMQDPEQKTEFHNQVARKLLEFPEALERDNYMQAVAAEYFINYEDLRRLVNGMGNRLGAVSGGMSSRERNEERQKQKREKEDGIRRSQRLLLTWLIENESLFDKIEGVITAEDFIEPLYHQVAELVFEGHKNGTLNPAAILNRFIDDGDQYREAAALFNASLSESLNNEEQKKAFSETVVKVKKNSLDEQSRRVTDVAQLQRLIQEQAALRSLHISLD